MLKCLKAALLMWMFFLFMSSQSCAPVGTTETLESSALRVELSTSPYSFRVIERATGAVLVSQNNTAFTENHYRVTAATDIVKKPDMIGANLQLSGTTAQAHVTFTFIKPGVVQVLLSYNDNNPVEINEEFKDQGEHYYGIWEYPFGGNIDNRGADWDFLGMRKMPGVNYSSARAPFYVTSGKYGIYVETTAKGHYTIAKAGKTGFSFQDTQLKYDIIYGPSFAEVLNLYNAMAGPSIMPPAWAFSTIWWRDDHHEDLRDVTNAQGKVIDDADRLRGMHIPASAIWLDRPYGTGELGWGNMDFDPSFPDPPKMVRDLNARGMNLLLWIANRNANQLFQEGTAKGYLFKADWPAADVRRPEVYSWFKDKLNAYVRLGIKGYKIDRGEEDEMPREVENLNAILVPKLAAEGLHEAYGDDYFVFTRNVNDTARKYSSVWNGDTQPDFSGLAVSIKNGLRSGTINFPMWGSDTGGYLGDPTKEVFARWLEFSAYSPMMEVLLGPKRTIWYDYDEELVSIEQAQTRAHHDLLPLTRSLMYKATQSGMPVMRLLLFEFPMDANLYDTWDEYLFGRDILVAPVITAGSSNREVYLPAGGWMNYNDRTTIYNGPAKISAEAPLSTIPLFVREGAIIPRGDILKANNNWDANWTPKLRVEFFPSAKVTSEFDYFTGSAVRKITAEAKSDGIRIKLDDLGVNGMLEVYCKDFKGLKRNGVSLREGADYSYDAKGHKLTVPFTGATELVIDGASSLFD